MTRLRKYVIRCLKNILIRLDDKDESFLAERTKGKDPRFVLGDRYIDKFGRPWTYGRMLKNEVKDV